MRVWRVTRGVYAATPLSGEGTARAGNRWNSRGIHMAYTSSSRPLAVLELLVHVTRATVPDDMILIPIDVPDDSVAELASPPAGWNDFPYSDAGRAAGDDWIRRASSLALLVPSAVLRGEHNLLLNPLHPEFARVQVQPPERDAIDPRLFGAARLN